MTRVLPPALIALIHKVEPPASVFMFMYSPISALAVPLVRITLKDDTYCTFRVEQLHITGGTPAMPMGEWRMLSTHGGTVPGESVVVAVTAARKAYAEITQKMTERAKQASHALSLGNVKAKFQ